MILLHKNIFRLFKRGLINLCCSYAFKRQLLKLGPILPYFLLNMLNEESSTNLIYLKFRTYLKFKQI